MKIWVPKLPRPSTRELIKYLNKKRGFVVIRIKGDHHTLQNHEGRYTTVPLRKEIGQGLLLEILADAGISREEFMKDWYG